MSPPAVCVSKLQFFFFCLRVDVYYGLVIFSVIRMSSIYLATEVFTVRLSKMIETVPP